MKSVIASLIASMATGLVIASPFQAQNCQLKAPPADSGEMIANANVIKVYPRKAAITKAYNGCQVTWAANRGAWTILGVTHFQKGEAAAFWIPPPGESLCKYQSGKAQGPTPGNCPDVAALSVRSMPAGCGDKILGRAGSAGCQAD